jgi:probable HAF family extracellular repeat protein
MKSAKLCITAVALVVALAIPVSLAAQEHPTKHHQYDLIDIGTLGGPNVFFNWSGNPNTLLGSNATVTGGADTSIVDPICWNNPDCFLMHGFKWQEGVMTDLGALPGGTGNNDSQAFWINDRGQTVGLSTTGTKDPLLNTPFLHAVLWNAQGKIHDLGTLGGQYSVSQAINSLGQVVGVAENAIPDPYNFFDYGIFGISGGTQSRAFLWDPKTEKMRDLGTLGSGNDAFAEYVNERGQVAGAVWTNSTPNSGGTLCGNNMPTIDPFFWEKGKMIDIGTLGGTCGLATGLNNRGQVIGNSDLAGDLTFHPFSWTKSGGMKDLGTFGGDNGQANALNDAGEIVGKADFPGNQLHDAFLWKNGTMTDLGNLGKTSNAHNINSSEQIVGASVINDAGELRPFLWENGGPMVDLSTLVPPHPGVHLDGGDTWLNDRGEILVTGTLSNGDLHAFLLTPCDGNHHDGGNCGERVEGETAAAQSSSALVTQDARAMAEGSSSTNDRTGASSRPIGPSLAVSGLLGLINPSNFANARGGD